MTNWPGADSARQSRRPKKSATGAEDLFYNGREASGFDIAFANHFGGEGVAESEAVRRRLGSRV